MIDGVDLRLTGAPAAWYAGLRRSDNHGFVQWLGPFGSLWEVARAVADQDPAALPHARDEDCSVDADGECSGCGAWHVDACATCEGQAYHRVTCPVAREQGAGPSQDVAPDRAGDTSSPRPCACSSLTAGEGCPQHALACE